MWLRLLVLPVFLFLFFASYSPIYAQGTASPQEEKKYEAVITAIKEEKAITDESGKTRPYQKLEALITNKDLKGKTIIIENGKIPAVQFQKYYQGDKIFITDIKDQRGKDIFYITDYVRRGALLWLFLLFLILVLLIGKLRGLTSLIGMVISFAVIFLFILPQISAGRDPVFIAILASMFIIPISFYLSHGLNKKTTSAVIGTIIALIITGLLANFFVNATKLTGFASDEANFLQSITQGAVNIKGLLLAGIIISATGILDDITITQAALVSQLKKASPQLSFRDLYFRTMDVGRDHIASVVNTLFLVYTGAALPLLLLFISSPLPFSEVINYEIIAEEIVRTLVASIGLILAIPITTLISTIFVDMLENNPINK